LIIFAGKTCPRDNNTILCAIANATCSKLDGKAIYRNKVM